MVELGLGLWLADFGLIVDVGTWRFSEDEIRDQAEVQTPPPNRVRLSCFDFAAL